MGIDGSCTVKLVRKNNGNAVKEFEDLTKYLNDLFKVKGKFLRYANVRERAGYAECDVTEKSVTIKIRSESDRSFFFFRCIAETICHRQPITKWDDLKWIPDRELGWDGRLTTICKRYDCWMTIEGAWEDIVGWETMDNNGVHLCEAEMSRDEYITELARPSSEKASFYAAKADCLKMIEDFINGR